MSDRIDPKFIEMIIAAKKAGKLEILNASETGAHLKFPYLQTQMDMHLGASNWGIVKTALVDVRSGEEN